MKNLRYKKQNKTKTSKNGKLTITLQWKYTSNWEPESMSLWIWNHNIFNKVITYSLSISPTPARITWWSLGVSKSKNRYIAHWHLLKFTVKIMCKQFSFERRMLIVFALLLRCFALWLVSKSCATFSVTTNTNRDLHMRFFPRFRPVTCNYSSSIGSLHCFGCSDWLE